MTFDEQYSSDDELRHWRICEGFGVGHYTTMGMHFETVQNHHPINRSFQTLPCSTGIGPPCYLCGFALCRMFVFTECFSSICSSSSASPATATTTTTTRFPLHIVFSTSVGGQRCFLSDTSYPSIFTHRPINQRTVHLNEIPNYLQWSTYVLPEVVVTKNNILVSSTFIVSPVQLFWYLVPNAVPFA